MNEKSAVLEDSQAETVTTDSLSLQAIANLLNLELIGDQTSAAPMAMPTIVEDDKNDDLVNKLKSINPDDLSPKDALNMLYSLKALIK